MRNLIARIKKSTSTPIAAAGLVAILGATAVHACPEYATFNYDDGYSLMCSRIGVVNGMCLMDCAVIRTGGGVKMI